MTTRSLRHSLNLLFFAAGLVALAPMVHAQIKVAKSDAMKAALHKPVPEYPVIARQMKATGQVEVEVSIAADGKVEDVKIVSGNPLLTKAAAKAAKDWTFTPFVENGQPSRAVTVLIFDFQL
jgi:protein TonB